MTEILKTRFNAVVDVNDHTPVTQTLGPFARVDDTTVTKKMPKVTALTQMATDSFQYDTTLYSGNENDITRINDIPTYVYKNSIYVNPLFRNDSWEFDQQSNATHRATIGPLGNSTVLSVNKDFWQETLSVALFVYVSPFLIIIGTLGNAV